MMFHPLPDIGELSTTPQLAHLAFLHTAGVLTTRALHLEHDGLDDLHPHTVMATSPSLVLATLLVRRIAELNDLIACYQVAVTDGASRESACVLHDDLF